MENLRPLRLAGISCPCATQKPVSFYSELLASQQKLLIITSIRYMFPAFAVSTNFELYLLFLPKPKENITRNKLLNRHICYGV